MKTLFIAAGCMLAFVLAPAHAQGNRFKPIAESNMTDAQKQAVKDMIGGAQGKRPGGMKDDEALVYQFLTELHATKTVSDGAFTAVRQKFGEQGVIDLTAVAGYYTMLAMILGVAGNPVPAGVTAPLPVLK